jgi:hypothetical protein
MTFLVSTGAVLFGAGEYKDGVFYRSSRAQFIDKDAGEKTRQGTRAILNTRSEHLLPAPHRDLYTRLHITSLDTKVSDEAIFLEVALTWLVLSASECGWDIARYYPRYPVRALKDTSRDIHHPIETESGAKVEALDIQEYLLEQVREFLLYMEGHCELKEWMWQAVSMWEGAISDLRNSAPEEWPSSSYWIDWWAKLHLLQTYQDDCPDTGPDVLPCSPPNITTLPPKRAWRSKWQAMDCCARITQHSKSRAPRRSRLRIRVPGAEPTGSRVIRQPQSQPGPLGDVTVNGRIRILNSTELPSHDTKTR